LTDLSMIIIIFTWFQCDRFFFLGWGDQPKHILFYLYKEILVRLKYMWCWNPLLLTIIQ